MSNKQKKYKFQFGGSPDDCDVLKCLLEKRWEIESIIVEDGYTWFNLINFYI